jgi:imidazolonepropionase-like amidohydrolase
MKPIVVIVLFFVSNQLFGQTIVIKAGSLVDIKNEEILKNAVVIINNNKIIEINYNNHIPDSAEVIDLKNCTILPGLIDCHTHIMAAGKDYDMDLYSNSTVYRALRAISHLKTSLLNGFTTIRDVGNEGTGYADIDIKRCITEGIIDAPRFIPSAQGIAIKGFYFPNTIHKNWGIDLPGGAQYVSGKDECIKAVREQISAGAEWIKVYLDWQTPNNGTKTTFTFDELSALINTANDLGTEVAVHAFTKDAINLAINLGARSIEHGVEFDSDLADKALSKNTFWCPTISLWEYYNVMDFLQIEYSNLRNNYKKGLKIVLGTDVGSFPWTINQAKELEYYVKNAGLKPIDAIKCGTINAAELLKMENEIGQLKPGYFADIIAVNGNPLKDITLLQNVVFVMKDGKVYKNNVP